ncbi:MAG: exopolyphosphatase [Schwartzia sp.]|nr:exopolyphosphatase [Schwartzia sp. (in: firmicutes)]
MLQAMIDIGSNTIRMAVYEIQGEHATQVMKRKHTVGLSAYVKDGIMQEDGIRRAAEVVAEYRDFLAGMGVKNTVAFTTAALRNAKNSAEAVAALEARTGLSIRVISGEEEAVFDFAGAIHDLAADDGVILDIGGGSTEIVMYRARHVMRKWSLPFGSLSLKVAYVKGLLPTPEEAKAIRQDAAEAVGIVCGELPAPEEHIAACGIGGTFKGTCALYRLMYGLPEESTHMETARFGAILAHYVSPRPPKEEDAVRLMLATPDRIHTLLPGLILADVLTTALGCREVVYSDSGVREGYLYSEILRG